MDSVLEVTDPVDLAKQEKALVQEMKTVKQKVDSVVVVDLVVAPLAEIKLVSIAKKVAICLASALKKKEKELVDLAVVIKPALTVNNQAICLENALKKKKNEQADSVQEMDLENLGVDSELEMKMGKKRTVLVDLDKKMTQMVHQKLDLVVSVVSGLKRTAKILVKRHVLTVKNPAICPVNVLKKKEKEVLVTTRLVLIVKKAATCPVNVLKNE